MVHSETFNSSWSSFTVPAGVNSITIRCWGEHGSDSTADGANYFSRSGGSGGYARGDLSVSSGDTLYLQNTGGGSGRSRTTHDDYNAQSGSGGDGALVYHNGSDMDDVVIAAGGGGGAGAISMSRTGRSGETTHGADSRISSLTAEDEHNESTLTAPGASHSHTSNYSGNSGSSSYDRDGGNSSVGCGGGGGGGYQGGDGGNSDAYAFPYPTYSAKHAVASGGGGGGGTTRGVSSTSTSKTGGKSSAETLLEFTSSISWSNPGLNVYRYGSGMIVEWNGTSIPTGYYEIKRDGVVIDTVSNSSTSYTDQDVPEGTYDYEVIAKNDYDSESSGIVSEEMILSWGQARDGTNLRDNDSMYVEIMGTQRRIVEAEYRDGSDLKQLR